MNIYEARHQFIEGLERYISGIETDERLLRLAQHVSSYHDELPPEACELVRAITPELNSGAWNYAAAAQAILQHLDTNASASVRPQRAA